MTWTRSKAALYLLGGLLVLACAVPARAQFGGGGTGGARRGGGMRNPDTTVSRDSNTPRGISAADALYELRMRLIISQEQSAAWEGFYAAYLSWTAQAARPRAGADSSGALQSVEQQLTAAQNGFASTEDLAQALKVLFSSLTQAQQHMADELVPRLLGLTSPSGQHVTAQGSR
jgi:hypothetical protein